MAAKIVLEETYFVVYREVEEEGFYERILITIAETKLRALEKIAAKTHPDFHCDCEHGCLYFFPHIITELTIKDDSAVRPLDRYNDIIDVKVAIDEHSPMVKPSAKR